MISEKITYTDYNGKERTETFYFNLSKAELTELQNSVDGGFGAYLNRIRDAENIPELVKVFKEIILMSYGEKSEDGKYFLKKKNGVQLSELFEQTEAYSVLFMKLANDDKAAAQFVNGIIPADVRANSVADPNA